MAKVFIDIDEMWIFSPCVDNGDENNWRTLKARENAEQCVDLPDDFLERYNKAADEFFTMNSKLESLFRQHFMKKD